MKPHGGAARPGTRHTQRIPGPRAEEAEARERLCHVGVTEGRRERRRGSGGGGQSQRDVDL